MPNNPRRLESHQEQFHRRWAGLRDPHVRSLAWLIEAPGLLDAAGEWQEKIAEMVPAKDAIRDWLYALDRQPEPLHSALAIRPLTRLGRYAENLLAYYFSHTGELLAHGVQIRDGNQTVGELDFLLKRGGQVLHWEFAVKLYLLEPSGEGQAADYFVGPNLVDTLGKKMHKVMTRQLSLVRHPAAQSYLPCPVDQAQALIKGWLFYRAEKPAALESIGIAADHCHGFWCELSEFFAGRRFDQAAVLPRLRWLAPADLDIEGAVTQAELRAMAESHFRQDTMPLLVALLEERAGRMLEIERGFIVPDDWRERAGQRRPGLGS